jgi:hypothetical protein
MNVMHRKEIDFHQVIFVDHRMQYIVEYEEELFVIHHNEFLSVELDRFLPKEKR